MDRERVTMRDKVSGLNVSGMLDCDAMPFQPDLSMSQQQHSPTARSQMSQSQVSQRSQPASQLSHAAKVKPYRLSDSRLANTQGMIMRGNGTGNGTTATGAAGAKKKGDKWSNPAVYSYVPGTRVGAEVVAGV